MILQALWQAIESWPLSQYIVTSEWVFPTLESVHVIAITTVIGTVALMDLRLLGLVSTTTKVTEVSHDTLRWTWGAFGLALVTGGLLFISKATVYMVNPYFVWKMALILLAGVNMAVFHVFTWPTVASWNASTTPRPAKIAGGLSIAIWLTVVFLGRMIGFTLDKFVAH
jgi:hypothetical protein